MGNELSMSEELTANGKIAEKLEKGSLNGISANITSNGVDIEVKSETPIHQNGDPPSLGISTDELDLAVAKPDGQPVEAPVISDVSEPTLQKEAVKKSKEEKVKLFAKMFKKKAGLPVDGKGLQGKENSNEDQTDVSRPAVDPQPETANPLQASVSITEPESVTLVLSPAEAKAPETDNGNSEPAENQEEGNPEENPVMNFFKTLVTPTKTPKKDTASPDATKEQSQRETQPAATTTVAQISEPPAPPKGMSVPPPPPPEPPKLEIKGESAAKAMKPMPKEEPKAAAKEPESSKAKLAKDTLSKLFRPKVMLGLKASKGKDGSGSRRNPSTKTTAVTIKEALQPAVDVQPDVEVQSVEPLETAKEVAQSVVEKQVVDGLPQPVVDDEKVDPSKASTLEAAAKPEPPPPVQDEKKTTSKSPFLSLFKPKVLVDHMNAKIQAASTSGVRLLRRTTGVAADPKKAASAPAAAAEAPQAPKVKEEPKPAAKLSEAAVDNKPASVASPAGDDGASVPAKLEKRNSIHLFFKNLGQKRHSTDAGVQTEPVVPAEKAK